MARSKWKWTSIATVPDLCQTTVKILTHLISRYQLPLRNYSRVLNSQLWAKLLLLAIGCSLSPWQPYTGRPYCGVYTEQMGGEWEVEPGVGGRGWGEGGGLLTAPNLAVHLQTLLYIELQYLQYCPTPNNLPKMDQLYAPKYRKLIVYCHHPPEPMLYALPTFTYINARNWGVFRFWSQGH
jgi:hypothetical protein